MIQFFTVADSRFSIVEEVAAAIDGGCRWINLCSSGMTHEELKEAAESIIPVCRDNDVILVIDDDVELVKELRVHGVRLAGSGISAKDARGSLGPHAIIGVAVAEACEVAELKGADADYVTADVSALKQIVHAAGELQLPVVATGDVNFDNMSRLIKEDGAAGLGLSSAVVEASDPSAYMARAIAEVKKF